MKNPYILFALLPFNKAGINFKQPWVILCRVFVIIHLYSSEIRGGVFAKGLPLRVFPKFLELHILIIPRALNEF